jgi:4-alpha-glucanotransferase
MGPGAYRFADFLNTTNQTLWQILPLNPPRPEHYSPYLSPSAFAGSPLLISPELLVQDGLLDSDVLRSAPPFRDNRVDYTAVVEFKQELLNRAYATFRTSGKPDDYERFCAEADYWLDDFALFTAIESLYPGKVWNQWDNELRDRHPGAIQQVAEKLMDRIEMEKFIQYVFHKQWLALRRYCNEKGVEIFGDIPIYVDFNSADVWTQPDLFRLDEHKSPQVVSGVPPDYFSSTGQLWGHPIYRWDALERNGYEWWMKRIGHNLKLCDLVRIDHFRGFVGYWEVPAHSRPR